MKIKQNIKNIFFLISFILFGIYFVFNRFLHPKKEMINLNFHATYYEVIWNYGLPDVIAGTYFFIPMVDSEKIVMYRIDDTTSYQLYFDKYKLIAFNTVKNGYITEKKLTSNKGM